MNGPDFQYDGLTAFAPITSLATSKKKGLMSAEDKAALDKMTATNTPDANGWTLLGTFGGKRRWQKAFIGLVTTAAQIAVYVGNGNTSPLPVGISTQGQLIWSLTARGPAQTAHTIAGGSGADALTGFGILSYTVDGSNLNANGTTIDYFLEVTER